MTLLIFKCCRIGVSSDVSQDDILHNLQNCAFMWVEDLISFTSSFSVIPGSFFWRYGRSDVADLRCHLRQGKLIFCTMYNIVHSCGWRLWTALLPVFCHFWRFFLTVPFFLADDASINWSCI